MQKADPEKILGNKIEQRRIALYQKVQSHFVDYENQWDTEISAFYAMTHTWIRLNEDRTTHVFARLRIQVGHAVIFVEQAHVCLIANKKGKYFRVSFGLYSSSYLSSHFQVKFHHHQNKWKTNPNHIEVRYN